MRAYSMPVLATAIALAFPLTPGAMAPATASPSPSASCAD